MAEHAAPHRTTAPTADSPSLPFPVGEERFRRAGARIPGRTLLLAPGPGLARSIGARGGRSGTLPPGAEGPVSERIRFNTNHLKVIEALAWLANERPQGLTFSQVARILYFADKDHLVRYGRPILGDTYIRMEHGPVPSLVYDMLKLDPFLDPDIAEEVSRAIVTQRNDGVPLLQPKRGRRPNLERLSRTDLECLRSSLERYGELSFQELRELTHRERAWREAPENGPMDYALMVDDPELVEELRETAPVAVF